MSIKRTQAGDTIVEVILAMSLLSMIIFIAWGTTNRATQISMNARKRVVMVNALKEQAEILKSKYRDELGKAEKLTGTFLAANDLDTKIDPCDEDMSASTKGFYYKTDSTVGQTGGYTPVQGDDSSRVWIQYTNNPLNKYIDFYVRGCWVTTGGSENQDNSQFIVRLNK